MPRSLIVAAAVAAELLGVPSARAEYPCADDVKQFCAEVRPGGGRVHNCLRENAAKLSPACGARLAATEERIRSRLERFGVACRRDIGRLCGAVKPGGGRLLACLFRNQDRLSSACEEEVESIQEAREKVTAVREACRADVERLCSDVPSEAGLLVDCLKANEGQLSRSCRSVDPGLTSAAAELIDAVEAMSGQERTREALEILQGVDTIAFSRSQVLFQVDSYQGLGGRGNANRLLFNPQLVFGDRSQFALQLKAPVLAVYPGAVGGSAQTGLGDVTTSLAWAFSGSRRSHQYLSLGLQWHTAARPALGGTWAVTPAYATSFGLARWLSLTGQLAWARSFAEDGNQKLNLLVLEPVIVANLPGRSFLVLDTRLGWNLVDDSFVPVMKGVVGIFTDRQKSLSISAWYQAALSSAAKAQFFEWAVGSGLAYFFDW
ncbi:cysteine rich repeat-containing protein [Anaeromyxobacter oryzae]|uniref:Uncharacterized protein n=1 Tax=Anaeromyxobacter oryzae TaxID=2918170 RepID=A0ABN6MYE3_9BACT|nr:cysteine rich repeat-containing protein [Anaeromyxobacter oryzae]BDG05626.1 hypothetical protein AMOR_46220 [Anaeromyxobacter oryzae]